MGDDCVLPEQGNSKRRGLAGSIFAYKVSQRLDCTLVLSAAPYMLRCKSSARMRLQGHNVNASNLMMFAFQQDTTSMVHTTQGAKHLARPWP